MIHNVYCPYCRNRAELVNGDVIYPRRPDLHDKLLYSCKPCDAYVGCHPGTDKPLGTLANADLRRARMAVHSVLDPLWKTGRFTRKGAYAWLSKQMNMNKYDCHTAKFDMAQCEKAIAILTEKRKVA